MISPDDNQPVEPALEGQPAAPATENDSPTEIRQPNRGWIAGIILVALGIIFLLQNLTSFSLNNWWALFILIPAIGSFASAWSQYRSRGRLTAASRGPLIGGLVLTLISLIFLFNLDFGRLWPVFLIIAGLGALVSALIQD